MALETLTLRAIGADDRTAWDALWTGYLEFYGTSVEGAAREIAFERLLSDAPGTFQGLIAWDNQTPLGLVHWVHHPHMWRPEGVLYLQDLFTAPTARGKGVARKLIEAVYADGDARGTPRVYWLTHEENYAGRMLYDRIARKSPFIRYDRVL
ncbi:GNAT family N-acetyltransferase [Jannaschia pohangensis]|uniref:Ribosomal protein S18 acetylase RimI n=1 Tax=Jannaschia pohangensis TaxID=390807 RepID=A0A1I3IX43_9RHOB|nr:GNAT family N-acetyltransferase [Jannaschia pohangensis]SFI52494.1 Ribosomal protein S18 acetylase RimI [Jannaschia pohangensis]